MPRKRPKLDDDPNVMDANQVVAFNFRLARERAGWTQEEVAERLEPHLGQRLKNTSISAIERSVESDRRRVFTVQEVVAFALTFDVSFLWFLIPPPEQGLTLEGLDGPLTELWRIAVGTDRQANEVSERLREFTKHRPDLADQIAEGGLDFAHGVGLDHYRKRRYEDLVDMVREEEGTLDELFQELRRLVDRYDSISVRLALDGDLPRRAYRNTSEAILGEKLWHMIFDEYNETFDTSFFLTLAGRDDVAWESIIDPTQPAVRDAVLQFARAVEPAAREYLGIELP